MIWAAIISLMTGMAVMSPAAGFALYLLSAIFAAFPAIFGISGVRIAGIALLALSILLSVTTYPKYDSSMATYRSRANKTDETKSRPPLAKPENAPER